MSTQLRSMRRLTSLASIGLITLVAATSLWYLQFQAASVTSDLATYPGAAISDQMLVANQPLAELANTVERRGEQATTAILFLIDESGGVSGKCGNANTSSVFVTDREGHRYELVRFYLQLWRAYYHFLQEEGGLGDEVRPIDIGIMQFARQDQPHIFLGLTAIMNLIGDEGANRFKQLQSQNTMLADVKDNNWFCWTDFPSALRRAAQQLDENDANKKIIVLLTDGSTRGNEGMLETENVRSATRVNIENALRNLQSSDIELLTVIWGANECNNENTCGLIREEFNQRKDDLRAWKDWEKQGLLTLVNDHKAIKALADTHSFSLLMPGAGQYATGWINDTAGQPISIFFSEVARLIKAVVITSLDVAPSDILFRPKSNNDDKPVDFARLGFERKESQWYWAENNIPGSNSSCPQRSLQARIQEPVLAYYWLPTEQDWPKIKSISVEPKELIIDQLDGEKISEADRTITITVSLKPIDMNHYNCFQIQVEVAGQLHSKDLTRDGSELKFSPIILAEDRIYGQIPITAKLVFKLQSDTSAGPETSEELRVIFQPTFPEQIDIANIAETKSVTVSVPITFAAQVPGFEPKFGVFPEPTFNPYTETPSPATTPGPGRTPEEENCPATQPLDSVLKSSASSITSDPASKFVTNYEIVFPKHAIERCGYKNLLVMWSSSDKEKHTWIKLVDRSGLPEKSTSIPVTPTPDPTPTPGNGWPNWPIVLSILFAIGGAIGGVRLWKRWRESHP